MQRSRMTHTYPHNGTVPVILSATTEKQSPPIGAGSAGDASFLLWDRQPSWPRHRGQSMWETCFLARSSHTPIQAKYV